MGKGIILIMMAAIAGALMMTRNSQEIAFAAENLNSTEEGRFLAREIARSAMNTAVAQARRDFANADQISYEGIAYQEGEYDLSASRPTPGTIELIAEGRYEEHTFRIKTTLVRRTPLEAPLILDVPSIDPKFTGPHFQISGIDTAPPSAPGQTSSPESDRNAVRVVEDDVRADLLDDIGVSRYDQVVGVEGDGDVATGPLTMDMSGFYDQASANRDFTVDAGQLKGNTWGSPVAPVVVFCECDAKLTGQTTGYGILVIDGQLDNSSGQMLWEGIIIVRGATPSIKLTGGTSIYGSLVVISTGGEADVTIGAHSEIRYSSKAIERVTGLVDVLDDSNSIVVADQWTGD